MGANGRSAIVLLSVLLLLVGACGSTGPTTSEAEHDVAIVGLGTAGAAVALARENARSLGISNVIFHQGSWCQPLVDEFDVIASNPPYVDGGDPRLQEGDLLAELDPDILSAQSRQAGATVDAATKAGPSFPPAAAGERVESSP